MIEIKEIQEQFKIKNIACNEVKGLELIKLVESKSNTQVK